jgi:hypothetical protein
MTTVTVLDTQVYTAGTHTIPATSIPDGVTQLGIFILRCTSADPTIWPNDTDTISYDLQVSLDDGVSYNDWAGGSDVGGIHINNKGGTEVATMNIVGDIPDGTNRFFQGTITFSADIKTGASVTVN